MVAGDLYEVLQAEIQGVLDEIEMAMQDGRLSFKDVWEIFFEVVDGTTTVLQSISGLTGAEKKAEVIKAALRFWDDVLAEKDLPGPDAIIDPVIRASIPAIVGALIEFLVARRKKYGWPDSWVIGG